MSLRFQKCSVADCARNAHRDTNGKRGFCSMHYQRVKKFGDPDMVKKPPSPAADWIEANKNYSGDDCLKWPFHISPKDGYGRAHYPDGRLATASRIMCIAAHGEPPSRRYECAHSCGNGNKACTNPKHLYWATPTQNQRERVDHGTSNRGEAQGQSKLTEEDVRHIRILATQNLTNSEIAKYFGIDQGHISAIISRKKWAWLD